VLLGLRLAADILTTKRDVIIRMSDNFIINNSFFHTNNRTFVGCQWYIGWAINITCQNILEIPFSGKMKNTVLVNSTGTLKGTLLIRTSYPVFPV